MSLIYYELFVQVFSYNMHFRSGTLFLFSNIQNRNYIIFNMTDLFLLYILQVRFHWLEQYSES